MWSYLFGFFVLLLLYHIGSMKLKNDAYARTCANTVDQCIQKFPNDLMTKTSSGTNTGGTNTGGTNPAKQACDAITCNGTNRTKKSNSEINNIPSTTSSSEYPDTTFRSPCCKWHNLPDPRSGKEGVDYNDFLNTSSVCPLDGDNTDITLAINAGTIENGGRKCGSFTLYAEAGPGTPSNLLTDGNKFPIHLIHDNPNRNVNTPFSCPTRCVCPQKVSGEYWNVLTDNWQHGSEGFIKCGST